MSDLVQREEEDVSESSLPPEPQSVSPDGQWEHFNLFQDVFKALFALPSFFKSDLVISGVLATDLFTFNSSLGATIEAQVASALNEIRSVWDPEQKYTLYRFVRQPQTFPDVTLRASAPDIQPQILMGIELKGWYILAKEREPSFRYKVTPSVCAPADLLVVYPWALSNVISGSPILFQPYVAGARFAAEYRNWYWRYKKDGKGKNDITISSSTGFYPTKSAPISDEAISDKGGNFGRFARTGLMDKYISKLVREELSGIPISAWQSFLSIFSEGWSEEKVSRVLDQIVLQFSERKPVLSSEVISQIKLYLQEIADLLNF
ncbi:MAG TPA: hypothetical protein VFQ36_19945 [Ktedonobacteraceae bacterium]|nr:hypothetical protein [Ktedonobacteraceae bacterium]